MRKIALVAESPLDRIEHALIEVFALFAIVVGGDNLAAYPVLNPGWDQLLHRVPADLDGNHGVVDLLDQDAHAVRDADVAVEPPRTLPRALPADAHEDEGHGVGDQLAATARAQLLEQEAPDVAVDLPGYPADQRGRPVVEIRKGDRHRVVQARQCADHPRVTAAVDAVLDGDSMLDAPGGATFATAAVDVFARRAVRRS